MFLTHIRRVKSMRINVSKNTAERSIAPKSAVALIRMRLVT